MLSDQLRTLKDKSHVTAQQLADRSGVPLSTINRILSGETANPSFQTVADIVLALNGSLDSLVGIPAADDSSSSRIIQHLISSCETKDRWLRRMFWFSVILVAVVIAFTIFDCLIGSIGYIRQ